MMFSACLLTSLLTIQRQTTPPAKTVLSTFLVHQGSAYVPSATFPIKSTTVYEQFRWSSDGSQLAIISNSSTLLPGAQFQKLSKGDETPITQRLSIWNRDTGRLRDVVVPSDPTTGFDKFFFLGRSLLFTTFSKTTSNRLWIAPESGQVQLIPFEKLSGGATYAPSRQRAAILVADGENLWLITPSQTRKLPIPSGYLANTVGADANDRAIIRLFGEGKVLYRLLDFGTGQMTPAPEAPNISMDALSRRPFILDTYSKASRKGDSIDERALTVDAVPSPIDYEDGGSQLDLVESIGLSRRRICLAIDSSRLPVVSDNGLSFAFITNGVLMARCMVKTDVATTKKLLGQE